MCDPLFIKKILKVLRVIKKTKTFELKEKYSELLYMGVRTESQRKNIGHELLNHSLDYLRGNNYIFLIIQTLLGSNGFKARTFYEKNLCTVLSDFEDRVWYIKVL